MVQNLISIADFDKDAINALFVGFADPMASLDAEKTFWDKRAEALRSKILVTIFTEPSTRTFTSFQSAFLKLGGNCIHFSHLDQLLTSKTGGESVEETGRFLSQYADLIVVRSTNADLPSQLSYYSRVPVISAGHGSREHPTTALSHLHSIWQQFGRLNHLTILVAARLPKRCIHSLLIGLSMFGKSRVIVLDPGAGEPLRDENMSNLSRLDIEVVRSVKDAQLLVSFSELDVLVIDEDPEDYDEIEEPVLLVNDDVLMQCRENVHLIHFKPVLRAYSAEVFKRESSRLAENSRKSYLLRAETMLKLMSVR
jgi:aspartate carbamoyltransferase catalytic subunit